MTLRVFRVEVKQLPKALNGKHARHFLSELESSMDTDRPCIVLDCSNVGQMGRPVIRLLLRCLEEAIKRNGDIKLASISEAGMATLLFTGVSRLFEMFETNTDAQNSFYRLPVEADLHMTALPKSYRASENST